MRVCVCVCVCVDGWVGGWEGGGVCVWGCVVVVAAVVLNQFSFQPFSDIEEVYHMNSESHSDLYIIIYCELVKIDSPWFSHSR